MRICAGKWRGRILKAPEGRNVRPTSDKVRQAVFNMLAARMDFEGCTALDLFCGTGALGIEALSRGAGFCTFIDNNPGSLALCRKNLETLRADPQTYALQKSDATRLPAGAEVEVRKPADLVFIDPPYRKNLVVPALAGLAGLADGRRLADGALCVVETESGATLTFPAPFRMLQSKTYGDTQIGLCVYEPAVNEDE